MSDYQGKFPKRIKSVSYSKETGLVLVANDGQEERLQGRALTTLAARMGGRLPRIGDDILFVTKKQGD